MTKKVTIEIPEDQLPFMQLALAAAEEMQDLALQAPEGTVLDACETAAVEKGRQIVRQMLKQTLASRIEQTEKNGSVRHCACGGDRSNRGPKTREILTVVGPIDVNRRYWQCRSCSLGGYFLDDNLGIQRGFSKTLQNTSVCFPRIRPSIKPENISINSGISPFRRIRFDPLPSGTVRR